MSTVNPTLRARIFLRVETASAPVRPVMNCRAMLPTLFFTVGPTSHGVRRDMLSPNFSGAASPPSWPLKYSCMCSTTLSEEFSAGSTSTKRRVWTLSASLPIDHSIIRPYQTAGFRASGRTFLASTMAKISSPLASMSA